jgi:WD40 repeat protein/tRNA A-37 threonylcarbamoyl transferase component Bud32
MMVRVRCPNTACGQTADVPQEAHGGDLRCPHCGRRVIVSAPVAPAPALQPPARRTLAAGDPQPTPAHGSPAVDAALPMRIGRFQVRCRLGSGAFGTVYRAFDPKLQREVAVKVPRDGTLANPQALRRFRREAKAAARLRHTHIVPFHEVGQDGSRPFIVSAFIEGQTLSRAIVAGSLDFRQAARVVAELAESLEHAHRQGIMHRDVKPANVLLDGQGRAYLTDFGLASLQETRVLRTRLGAVLGTPAYVAPEQAEGWTGQALPASDQYALGVVLYELLCGQTPFGGPPEVVLYNAANTEIPPPRGVRPDVPAELERICLKALAKRPEQRFPSCLQMAEELRRWLLAQESGQTQPTTPVAQPTAPVWSGPVPPQGGHGRGLAWVGGAAVVCLLLLGLSLLASRRVPPADGDPADRLARSGSDSKADQGKEDTGQAKDGGKDSEDSKGNDRKAAGGNDRGKDGEKAGGKDAGKDSAGDKGIAESEPPGEGQQSAGKSGGKPVALPTVEIVKSEPAQPEAGDDLVVQLRGTDPDGGVPSFSFRTGDQEDWQPAPDGRVVLADLAVGTLRLEVRASNAQGSHSRTVTRTWEVEAWKPVRELRGHTALVYCVAFSPDGKRLASASGDKTVKVWDARTGKEVLALQGHTSRVTSVAFSPDGNRIASGSGERGQGEVKVWDAPSGQEVLTLKGDISTVTSVAFSPNGKHIAIASWNRTVKVWDTQTDQAILDLKGHTASVNTVAFSSDGKRIASGADDKTVRVWDAETGAEVLPLKGHTSNVFSVAFSPDGKRIASGSSDKTVKVWDLQTGQAVRALQGHTSSVNSVAFSPDGTYLASGDDNTVKLWDVQSGKQLLSLKGHTSSVNSVAFRPDGKRLASASGDETVRLWAVQASKLAPTQQPREILLLTDFSGEVRSVCYSPDGKQLATASNSDQRNDRTREVKVWDAQTGKLVRSLPGHKGYVSSVCFSPDGKYLASADGGLIVGGEVKVWDARTGKVVRSLQGHKGDVTSVCFSPDGKYLASASVFYQDGKLARPRGEVKVWDAETGQDLHTLKGHTDIVTSVCFSPDGKSLASGSGDKTVKVWDWATEKTVLDLQEHTEPVTSVCFSPNGERLASASADRSVKVWDAQTGQRLLDLTGHLGGVLSVAYSPDGKRLASGSSEQTVEVWDAQTGQVQRLSNPAWRGHTQAVTSVCFSPNGERLVTASADKTVKVWQLPPAVK